MPTPTMKGKEVIYWIKVSTDDTRLASDIQKFLEGAPSLIDLRVPSAFIATKTELESFRVLPQKAVTKKGDPGRDSGSDEDSSSYRLEILLRRTLPEGQEKRSQSPYG